MAGWHHSIAALMRIGVTGEPVSVGHGEQAGAVAMLKAIRKDAGARVASPTISDLKSVEKTQRARMAIAKLSERKTVIKRWARRVPARPASAAEIEREAEFKAKRTFRTAAEIEAEFKAKRKAPEIERQNRLRKAAIAQQKGWLKAAKKQKQIAGKSPYGHCGPAVPRIVGTAAGLSGVQLGYGTGVDRDAYSAYRPAEMAMSALSKFTHPSVSAAGGFLSTRAGFPSSFVKKL